MIIKSLKNCFSTIKEFEDALYRLSNLGLHSDLTLKNLPIDFYQEEFRFYISDYPEQENLRSEYFRKTRDNYFWNRFMEVK